MPSSSSSSPTEKRLPRYSAMADAELGRTAGDSLRGCSQDSGHGKRRTLPYWILRPCGARRGLGPVLLVMFWFVSACFSLFSLTKYYWISQNKSAFPPAEPALGQRLLAVEDWCRFDPEHAWSWIERRQPRRRRWPGLSGDVQGQGKKIDWWSIARQWRLISFRRSPPPRDVDARKEGRAAAASCVTCKALFFMRGIDIFEHASPRHLRAPTEGALFSMRRILPRAEISL
jgi:hypothetical protein